MWGVVARLGSLLGRGLGKGLSKARDLFGWWARPYRPYPAPPPSVKERHDPLTALGMILLGGPLTTINLGPLGEVLKHAKAFVDDVVSRPGRWDGLSRRSGKEASWAEKFLYEQKALRESAVGNFKVPTASPGERRIKTSG